MQQVNDDNSTNDLKIGWKCEVSSKYNGASLREGLKIICSHFICTV